MTQLENLLQQCIVKLTLPGHLGWGTGFFVAPGWILTCAHVVQEARDESVQVRWQKQENWAQATVERLLAAPFDLALLKATRSTEANLPCVYFDEEIRSRDPLYLFGYPDQDFPNGCPVTFNCEGLTGDESALIKFALGQVRPGMSGSPLLNQRTGKVCGIVKFTRDRSFDLGGGAISTHAILEQFPELRSLQRTFHQKDDRWVRAVEQKRREAVHEAALQDIAIARMMQQEQLNSEQVRKFWIDSARVISDNYSTHDEGINDSYQYLLDGIRQHCLISDQPIAIEEANELWRKILRALKEAKENFYNFVDSLENNFIRENDLSGFFKYLSTFQEVEEVRNTSIALIYNEIGKRLLEMKKLKGSCDVFEKSIKTDKNNKEARFYLADIYFRQGRRREGIQALEEAEAISEEKNEVEKIRNLIKQNSISQILPLGELYAYLVSRRSES